MRWRSALINLFKILFLIVLILQGCGLLRDSKRTGSTDRSSIRTSTATLQAGSVSSAQLMDVFAFRRDSSDLKYAVRFRPKGRFTFSFEKGFEGEAGEVMVNGYFKAGNLSVQQEHRVNKDTAGWRNQLQKKERQEVTRKTHEVRRSVSWKWVVGVLVVILASIGVFITARRIHSKKDK